jgi:hypothetical protein
LEEGRCQRGWGCGGPLPLRRLQGSGEVLVVQQLLCLRKDSLVLLGLGLGERRQKRGGRATATSCGATPTKRRPCKQAGNLLPQHQLLQRLLLLLLLRLVHLKRLKVLQQGCELLGLHGASGSTAAATAPLRS